MSHSRQRTPKSGKKNASTIDSPSKINFETVIVSPSRSPSKGNLTGTARIVKDGVADWHNSIDKWNVYNGRGLDIINQIANINLQAVFKEDKEDNPSDLGPDTPSDFTELQNLCDKLLSILQSVEKLLKKMEGVTSSMKGVVELERHQNEGVLHPDPLFLTWPINKFYETCEELLCMYQKEAKLKRVLVENVAHTYDRSTLMYYSTAWHHQPYIDDSAKFLLESMLHETGHR